VNRARAAWVDESIRHTPEGQAYLLAAAVANPNTCDPVRDVLRSMVLGKASRLHWRAESRPRRVRIVAAIAAAAATDDIAELVVVGVPVDPARQERARRQCLVRLLHELDTRHVTQVWAEARTPTLNRRDVSLIAGLRASGAITDALIYDFASPAGVGADPMLWIPDAVAGAVGTTRVEGDSRLQDALGDSLTVIDLQLA